MPAKPPRLAEPGRSHATPGPATEAACSIGLDIGTTTLKAIAVSDRSGREVARAQATVDLWTDETGAAEQEPDTVYEALTGVLAEVVRESRAAGHRVARIGLSAAMHS